MVKMAGKQKYRDLKYLFIRGLLNCEKWQRSRHYLKSAAEWTSRAIVSLELTSDHIKTVKQATRLEGIGPEIGLKLKEIQNKHQYSTAPPDRNTFISSAAALLVTLLELTDQCLGSSSTVLIPEDLLKSQSQKRCEEKFLDDTNTAFCPAWWRIEVLIKRDFIKRRSVKKLPVYQLLPLGRNIAVRLLDSTMTAVNGIQVEEEAALYTNDDGTDGVVLLVDTQEMGGDRVRLADLCGQIKKSFIRFRTEKLLCGDYSWVWRCDLVERVLPLLIERKRADDVAHSLKDGRFWKQINKMILWKERFTRKKIESSLKYVVEGDPDWYVVQCTDGCHGVGKCGNPNLAQVKLAIADLESHPQLDVHMTTSTSETVQLLAILTDQLAQKAQRGEFDMLLVGKLNDDEPVVEVKHSVTVIHDCLHQQDNPTREHEIRFSQKESHKNKRCFTEKKNLPEIHLSNHPENVLISSIPLLKEPFFDLNMNKETLDHALVKVEDEHVSLSNEYLDGAITAIESNSNIDLQKEKKCSKNEDIVMQEFRSVKALNADSSTNTHQSYTHPNTTNKQITEASTNKKIKLNFVSKPEYIKRLSPAPISPAPVSRSPTSRSKGRIYLMKMLKTSNVTNNGKLLSKRNSVSYLKSDACSSRCPSETESCSAVCFGTNAKCYLHNNSGGIDANHYINHTAECEQAERNSSQSDSLASSPPSSCRRSEIDGQMVSCRSIEENISTSVQRIGEAENSSVHEKQLVECERETCKHNADLQLNNTAKVNKCFSQRLNVPRENRNSQTVQLVNEHCQDLILDGNESCKMFGVSSEEGTNKNLLSYSSNNCGTRWVMAESDATLFCTEETRETFADQDTRFNLPSVDSEQSSSGHLPHHYSKHSGNNLPSHSSCSFLNDENMTKSPIPSHTSGERKRFLPTTEHKIQQVLCVLPQMDPSKVAAMLQNNDDVEQIIVALLDSST